MTGLPQIHPALDIDLRSDRMHLKSQTGLGEDKVKLRQDITVGLNRISGRRYLQRQRKQDLLHFHLFGRNDALEIVVHVDQRHRLDKHCCATGRLVMQDTGKLVTVFLFDRNHIAIAAHRIKGILKITFVLR